MMGVTGAHNASAEANTTIEIRPRFELRSKLGQLGFFTSGLMIGIVLLESLEPVSLRRVERLTMAPTDNRRLPDGRLIMAACSAFKSKSSTLEAAAAAFRASSSGTELRRLERRLRLLGAPDDGDDSPVGVTAGSKNDGDCIRLGVGDLGDVKGDPEPGGILNG